MRRERIVATGALLMGGAGGILLYWFPPTQYSFYPRCPIYAYFHVLCPGCGATRALAALLHGHLRTAMHWNALFVLLLPLLAGYAAVCCYRAMRNSEFRWPQPPREALAVMLTGAVVFTVARNLWS